MKITNYELFEVPPRWLFLKVVTDTGTVGWGEPVVEGRVQTVRAAVSELVENYLLDKNPLRIEDHWQAMYHGGFYRGGPILMSAIAGIDQALWDIKGKHYGAPVYELLGGPARDRIRVYQWAGGEQPSDVAREAASLVDRGYTAVKMDATERLEYVATPEEAGKIINRVASVRDAVGDDVDVCVDFRGRVSKAMAKRLMNRLDAYEPAFVEEPISPEHNHHLPTIETHTTTPIATGERLYTRWDCRPLFEQGSVDVIQPVISHAGGISEVLRIASLAETYDVTVAPNCPLGPIAVAASLQVCTRIPNLFFQDHGSRIQPEQGGTPHTYLEDPSVFHTDDGYVEPLDDPGLGITISEETVREMSETDIDWTGPLFRHPDGSIAGW
jgi:galactonate dehydratase